MRTKLKAGWLQYNIGKTNKLFRKYKAFYNKILNINKIFYMHRIAGIPMHPETIKICHGKLNNYLIQMDSLWHVMIYDELAPEYFKRHNIGTYLGTWEKSVYVSFYRSSKSEIMSDRKSYQERKNQFKNQVKSAPLRIKLTDKIKSLFGK